MNKSIEIKMENDNKLVLTEEEYETVAAYVRNQDRLEYAYEVLCNNLSCMDEGKSNLEAYLTRSENLSNFANKLDEEIHGNTGEVEYTCVDEAVKKAEPGIYRVISNKYELVYMFKNLILNFEGWKYRLLTPENETIVSGAMDFGDIDIINKYIEEFDYEEAIKKEVQKLSPEDKIHIEVYDSFSSDAFFLKANDKGIEIKLIKDTAVPCYENGTIVADDEGIFVNYKNICTLDIIYRERR